jgi:putative membrane protein
MKILMMSAAFGAAILATPAMAQVMTPTEYVTTAGASDLYEITSSRIVLETTQNPALRDFAQMMVAQHTKSTADVKGAASKSRVKVAPPKLTPMQQELVTELRAEKGPARDAAYIAQQKAAHGQALAVQKAYAMEGTAPALKTAAAGIVPVVEHHIMMLKAM